MNRDELIAAMRALAGQKPAALDVPKLGTVYVRPRTLEEVDADAASEVAAQKRDEDEGRHRRLARAVANVICDENGQRVLDASKGEDIDLLASQPYYVLRRILNAAGGGEEDEGKPAGASS